MHRRRYLMATGAVASAICGGTVAADEHDDNDTANNESYGPALRVGDQRLVVDQSGFSPTAYAVVEVENEGAVASGEVSLTVGWLDEAESRIDEDSGTLPSLGAGETWLAHIQSFTEPETITGFTVAGEFETGQPRSPDGLTVAESDLLVDEDQITGRVENTREEDLEPVEAHGKLYSEDGTVLGGGTDWEGALSAGQDWTFEIRLPQLPEVVEDAQDYEVPAPTDYDVLLDTRTHRVVERT